MERYNQTRSGAVSRESEGGNASTTIDGRGKDRSLAAMTTKEKCREREVNKKETAKQKKREIEESKAAVQQRIIEQAKAKKKQILA